MADAEAKESSISGKENKEGDLKKRESSSRHRSSRDRSKTRDDRNRDKDRDKDRDRDKRRDRSRTDNKHRHRESSSRRRSDRDDKDKRSSRSGSSSRRLEGDKDSLRTSKSTHGDGKSSSRNEKDALRRSTSHASGESRNKDRDRRDSSKRRSERDSSRRRSDRDRDRGERRDSSRRRSDRDKERSSRRDSSRDRKSSRSSRYYDKDREKRSSRSRRHDETKEEREERKKRERAEREEEEQRRKEKEERREKEREERRKKDEELKKQKEELRAQRRKEKGIEEDQAPASLMVNRADLRQVSKEKFNNVYSMGRMIYKGDEGTRVYKCYHRATGTERCVKITPKKSSVCHEFDMLKNMDHPNILTMYDLFVEESDIGFDWYLVIDLCKGKSLYYYLQKRSCKPDKEVIEEKEPEPDGDFLGIGAFMMAAEDAVNATVQAVSGDAEVIVIEEGEYYGLDEAEVKQVMLQVMSCVNYLHKNRLVHADIKPQNLIMATGIDLSTIKMLDFDNSALLRNPNDKISMKKGTPEYMAPEVHAGNKYDYKCDIWSCGVLAYQLLSNSLPFGDSKHLSEDEIAAKVEDGKFSMAGPAWGKVSDGAKDFVKSLLVLRDRQRPTAEKAIHHKWLTPPKKLDEKSTHEVVKLHQDDTAVAAMKNFRNFKADSKLKKATCSFIASQLLTKEEKEKIDTIFRTMDITRDGKLSKAEVKAGFYKVSGVFMSDQEIDDMFARVDCDGTGEIEYSEFVIASMSETDLLSTDRLRKAFQLFDKDNSGNITISELREIFSFFQTAGSDMDDEYIDKVIAQVDSDGDGDVSFEEFCEMMKNGIPV